MAAQEEIILKVSVDGSDDLERSMIAATDAANALARSKKTLNEESKKLDKSFEALQAEGKKLSESQNRLNNSLKKGTISQKAYDSQTKKIKASSAALSTQYVTLEKSQLSLAQKQVALKVATKEASKEYQNAERTLLNSNKAALAASGSYNQLSAKYNLTKVKLNAMSKAQIEGTASGRALQKESKALFTEMDRLQKATGKSTLSVGNYGNAFSAATPLMGAFGSKINMVQSTLVQIKTALKASSTATKANAANTTAATTAQGGLAVATKGTAVSTGILTKGFKFLKIAIASTGIGALVILLGAFITAMASTQKGMDALNRVIEPIKETFATLFGIIQDVGLKVFESLKKAINNPKQALKDFATALKQNFINRLQGASDFVKAFGSTVISSFKLMGLGIKKALASVPILGAGIDQEALKKDLAQAKNEAIKASKELAVATAQIATGLNKEQQKAAIKLTKDLSAEGQKRLAEANKRGLEMAALEQAISEGAINLESDKAEALRNFELQKEIAQNVLLTDKERIVAAKEATRQLELGVKVQADQLKKEIELATLRTKANDTTNEEKKELKDLTSQLVSIEAGAIKKRILLGNLANTIVKKRIAINKKAADDQLKAVQKLSDAREKADENEIKRAFEADKTILDNKAEQLKLEADLEAVNTEQTEAQKIQSAIELERKLGQIRLDQNALQDTELLRKQKKLENEILETKKAAGGKETVQSIEQEDQLKALKLEREKLTGEELSVIKQENLIAEKELLREQQGIEDEIDNEKLKEQEKLKSDIKNAALQATQIVTDGIFNNKKRQIDDEKKREIESLQAKKDAGVITQKEFEVQRLAIDKKAFKDQKKADTSRAIVNGALAITKVFATTPSPANFVAAALVGVKTAAEVSTIQSQSFAEGGFTGGGIGSPDSSGHKPAGVVHANEYVVPKTVLQSSEGSAAVASLERMRLGQPSFNALKGFANGGFTSQNVNVDLQSDGFKQEIVSGVAAAMQEIRVVNVSTETAQQANRDIQIKNQATF